MSREFHITTELIMACWYCVERVTESRLARLQKAVDGYGRYLFTAGAAASANPLLAPLRSAALAMLDSNWKDAAERRADLAEALSAFGVVQRVQQVRQPVSRGIEAGHTMRKLPVRSVREPRQTRDPSDGSVNQVGDLPIGTRSNVA